VRKGIIPNWLTYSALAAAVVLSFLDSDRLFLSTIAGFLVAFLVPFLLFMFGRLGGGDVKLLAVLGAALGYPLAVDLLLWTCVFGFLVAFVTVLVTRRFKELCMDFLEIIMVAIPQKMIASTDTPVSGLSTPLAVAIFLSVCWLIFFPDYSQLMAHLS